MKHHLLILAFLVGLLLGGGGVIRAQAVCPPESRDHVVDWLLCQGRRVETFERRLAALEARPRADDQHIRDLMWDQFFVSGGWSDIVIGRAETLWQSRRRPWAATFTRERTEQVLCLHGYVNPRCP